MFRAYAAPMLLLVLAAPVLAAEQLSDPTRPPGPAVSATPAAAPPAQALELSSIIYGAERRLARINGQWVGEGDAVGGSRVLRIEPEVVHVARGGRERSLRVNATMDKRPSKAARDGETDT